MNYTNLMLRLEILLSIHHAFSINGDVDRLYVPRKQGGRGLLSITDVVNRELTSLQLYVNSSSEPLLQMVSAQWGWGFLTLLFL